MSHSLSPTPAPRPRRTFKAGRWLPALLGLALLAFAAAPAKAGERRLGIGIHYWQTFDGLPDVAGLENIEDEGQSIVLSYQSASHFLFRYQVDLEYFEGGSSGSTSAAFSPQVFLVVGGSVYGAVGLGVTVSDGLSDDVSDPFYMGRIGVDISLLGAVHVDLNATYRVDDWKALEGLDVDTDSFTLGAVARFRF